MRNINILERIIPLALVATACGGPEGLEGYDGLEGDTEERLEVDTSAEGLGSGSYGWAWISNGSGTVGSSYSSSGGTVSVSHITTGRYRVTFNGINAFGGNVQVVAEGPNANRCKVENWGGLPVSVNVRCHSHLGSAVNTSFIVVYANSSGGGPGRWAYAWANEPTSGIYTPSPSFQSHYNGGSVAIVRLGVGSYRVFMAGVAGSLGNAQVTAYGSSSDHCNIDRISTGYLDVKCWTTTNAPVDTLFSVAFMSSGAMLAPDFQRAAHYHADRTTAIYPYTPTRLVTVPGTSATTLVTSDGTGHDHISFNWGTPPLNLSLSWSAALAVSYGSGASYCKPARGTDGFPVDVRCYLRQGSIAYGWNAEYLGQHLSRQPIF